MHIHCGALLLYHALVVRLHEQATFYQKDFMNSQLSIEKSHLINVSKFLTHLFDRIRIFDKNSIPAAKASAFAAAADTAAAAASTSSSNIIFHNSYPYMF